MTQPHKTGRYLGRRAVIGLGLAAIVAALPAFAQGIVDDIVQQLRDQGYAQVTIERTWLGRTRILARGAAGSREIILNPNTGEILRDVWQGGSGGGDRIIDDEGGKGRGRGGDDAGSGGSGGDDDNSGSGSDDDHDDDSSGGSDDDDNDDGGGGGNSGSGGGDDDD